jgi:hypothetical protein
MLKVTQLHGFGAKVAVEEAPPGDPSVLTATDNTHSTTDTTTYTFSTRAFGDEAADRRVIVGVATRGGTVAVTSVTIGGVAGTELVTATNTVSGNDLAAIYGVELPSGTTGDVVVVLTSSPLRCGIQIWSLTGGDGDLLPDDTGIDTASDPLEATLDFYSDGCAAAMVYANGSGSFPGFAWTNLTPDNAVNMESTHGYASAHANGTAAGAATVVTCNSDNPNGTNVDSLAVASWA